MTDQTSTAISLAGHLKLDNLVLLYDNNQVTCDGPLDWINTEDINAKMEASGWHVFDVLDATYDVSAIVSVLETAKSIQKPVFVNMRTIIGVDMASAGTAKAHHGGFDDQSISASKALAGLSPTSRYEIPKSTQDYLRSCRVKGASYQELWDETLSRYAKEFPDQSAEFASRRKGSTGDYQRVLNG